MEEEVMQSNKKGRKIGERIKIKMGKTKEARL